MDDLYDISLINRDFNINDKIYKLVTPTMIFRYVSG
jgi:hypothetical protein